MRNAVQASEFLDFLKRIDTEMPNGPDVHLAMDDYATHKTPRIKAWLARRPHWHVHFTPTSASWINQVERWFAELTRKQLCQHVQKTFLLATVGIFRAAQLFKENLLAAHCLKAPGRGSQVLSILDF